MRNQGIAGWRRLRRIGRPEEMSQKKIQKRIQEKEVIPGLTNG